MRPRATTVNFFDPSQIAPLVSSGVTSDTISSSGYLFTYTRDKLFTGGIGLPVVAHIAADATIFTIVAHSGVI